VLEHLSDPQLFLEHLRKMLAPGGAFVGLVPARSLLGLGYMLFHRANGLRVRLFGRKSIAKLAQQAGLDAIEIRRCGLFSLTFKLRAC
jgi:2-polyprenyl-3-methyl-5-hydroxy-6-metoxy-1,4-benzoquinol methylase